MVNEPVRSNATTHSAKWPTWRTVLCIIRLFQSSTCFELPSAHHQEVNSINTASGIVTLSGRPDGHLQRVTLPEAVLVELTSWWWTLGSSKHVEDWNKRIIQRTVCQVGVTYQSYAEMHGQRNVKCCNATIDVCVHKWTLPRLIKKSEF